MLLRQLMRLSAQAKRMRTVRTSRAVVERVKGVHGFFEGWVMAEGVGQGIGQGAGSNDASDHSDQTL